MNRDCIEYRNYVSILKEELIPAMGCTEPIAVAYGAAVARETLGTVPERVEIFASGNIIKNVKSVVVPNTGGLRGIAAAAAAGILAGKPEKQLQVISEVTEEQKQEIDAYVKKTPILISTTDSDLVFDLIVDLSGNGHSARVRIANYHTNIVLIEKDDTVLHSAKVEQDTDGDLTDRTFMKAESILDFAETVDLADVQFLLDLQIKYNMAIAEEGLRGDYGANIGNVLLKSYEDLASLHDENSILLKCRAYAAAGSDARMSGCELPVIIVSGSGNQGMTASLPVVVYADEYNKTDEELIRAVILSDLITIHQKSWIGRLSAFCGAISAGCGAAAGIAFLMGGGYDEIAHTLVNSLAIISGVVCDGAKASCAGKIAAAVNAGLLGYSIYKCGSQFYAGDGIVSKGVENTIKNVGRLGSDGMRETDKEIIRIMTEE